MLLANAHRCCMYTPVTHRDTRFSTESHHTTTQVLFCSEVLSLWSITYIWIYSYDLFSVWTKIEINSFLIVKLGWFPLSCITFSLSFLWLQRKNSLTKMTPEDAAFIVSTRWFTGVSNLLVALQSFCPDNEYKHTWYMHITTYCIYSTDSQTCTHIHVYVWQTIKISCH